MSPIGNGIEVVVLEGETVGSAPRIAGAAPGERCLAVLTGANGIVRFDETLLSKHLLFLGSIGSGKTNAMMHIVQSYARVPALKTYSSSLIRRATTSRSCIATRT